MGYALSWHVPGRVMLLHLSAETTPQEFEELNKAIVGNLNQHEKKLFLIIDVNNFRPNALIWDRIRATQTYVAHENLEYVLIIGQKSNRLVRLMMLVLFNVSKAGLKFFETLADGDTFLERFTVTSS